VVLRRFETLPFFAEIDLPTPFVDVGLGPLEVPFDRPVFLAASFGTDRAPVLVASPLVLSECVVGLVPVVFCGFTSMS
jgi:hypothetical protein